MVFQDLGTFLPEISNYLTTATPDTSLQLYEIDSLKTKAKQKHTRILIKFANHAKKPKSCVQISKLMPAI